MEAPDGTTGRPQEGRSATPSVQNQAATYLYHVFAARQDVYSKWIQDTGWRPVREPLTAELVLGGLTGSGPAISGFMISAASTSHVWALDYDRDDGHQLAVAMTSFLAEQHLPAYLETSRRGAHLWCILEEPAPAVAIRAAIHGLLQAAGQPDDPKIELRPGSDHIEPGGLGHALRLPWQRHPLTGVMGKMFDASGNQLGPSIADALLQVEVAPVAPFLSWAERWQRPPVGHSPSSYHQTHSYPPDDSSASEILRTLWGAERAQPGRTIRCPAHDDKLASLSILRDDRRAICKAGHCILNNDDRGRGTFELRRLAARHE